MVAEEPVGHMLAAFGDDPLSLEQRVDDTPRVVTVVRTESTVMTTPTRDSGMMMSDDAKAKTRIFQW